MCCFSFAILIHVNMIELIFEYIWRKIGKPTFSLIHISLTWNKWTSWCYVFSAATSSRDQQIHIDPIPPLIFLFSSQLIAIFCLSSSLPAVRLCAIQIVTLSPFFIHSLLRSCGSYTYGWCRKMIVIQLAACSSPTNPFSLFAISPITAPPAISFADVTRSKNNVENIFTFTNA